MGSDERLEKNRTVVEKLMRTQDLKTTILYLFGRRKFYGYEAHKELEANGIKIGIGRLYSILGEMLTEGILLDEWKRSQSGPRKRVYWLSDRGHELRKHILSEAIEIVHKFYIEYLDDLPSEVSPLIELADLIMTIFQDKGILLFIAPEFTAAVKELSSLLAERIQVGRSFLVLPSRAVGDITANDWQVVEGAYNKIPLKESSVNLILVVGYRPEYSEKRTLQEWVRLLRKDGSIAIATPSVLVEERDSPMTIDAFIEKHEHETMHLTVDWNGFKSMLGEAFKRVRQKSMASVTTLLASGIREGIKRA
ncbi:MAG: PadR family transcriptional regulator [Candidatus Thorarchaeota archaeon]